MRSIPTGRHSVLVVVWILLSFFYDSSDGYHHNSYNSRGRRGVLSLSFVSTTTSPLFSQRYASSKTKKSSSPSLLWAKPPPTAQFDLAAIEAYESSLLLQQQQSDGPFDDDDDDDEYYYDIDDDSTLDDRHNTKTKHGDTVVYTVPTEMDNLRMDAAVTALLGSRTVAESTSSKATTPTPTTTTIPTWSRSMCGNLVADGKVMVDDNVETRKSFKVKAGQVIQIRLPAAATSINDIVVAQDLPLSILYEDESMIVLNKAAGMVVHPAAGNWDGTVVNALAYYLQYKSPYGSGEFLPTSQQQPQQQSRMLLHHDNGDDNDVDASNTPLSSSMSSFRPGIVHRLDKGTTGVLVVAKTSAALSALSQQFSLRQVQKMYLAITVGNPGPQQIVIDKPIGRHPIYRQRMRVVPDHYSQQPQSDGSDSSSKHGRRAVSFVNTLAFDGKLGLVQVRIETGRTHQIRVHLQDRRTPIYGDDVYGLADWNKRLQKSHSITRPLLHAYKLQLFHPVTGETMMFHAPLANDMRKIAMTLYPEGPEMMPEAFACTTRPEQVG